MVQLLLASFLAVLFGGLICLAVATDPNVTPSPQRQRLLPIGLAMLFAGVGSLGVIFGIEYFEDDLPQRLGVLAFFGGYGLCTVGGGALGLLMGRRRNRKFGY